MQSEAFPTLPSI